MQLSRSTGNGDDDLRTEWIGEDSIINLISGYSPERGQLSLDRTPYEDVNMRRSDRRWVGEQEPTIVLGTMGNNIKYGSPSTSNVELWQAAHLSPLMTSSSTLRRLAARTGVTTTVRCSAAAHRHRQA